MASKREDLEINVRATDKASEVLSDVADKTEKLDGTTADVTIEADDKATAEVRALMQRIEGLTDDDKKVILTAEAKKLEAEVRRATILLGQVDGETATAVLDARNNAQTKLDAVQSELADIDGTTADATLEATDRATSDINRVDGKLDELDRTTVDATIDATEGAGLSGIFDKIDNLPTSVGRAGTVLTSLASPTGAIAGVIGGLALAGIEASEVALEVDQIAQFTGDSVEDASRLRAVFSDNQVETTDLLDIIGQMSGVLADNPQLVTDMGISMDTVRQGPVAVLTAVMKQFWADGKLSDEERIVAMQLFGEEGVRQINNIAAAVDGDLAAALAAVDAGRIITEEDIAKAREFQRQWAELIGSFQSLALTVGPPVIDFLSDVVGGLDRVQDLIGLITDGDLAGAWDQIWNNPGLSEFDKMMAGWANQGAFFDSFSEFVSERGPDAEALGLTADGLERMAQAIDDGVDPTEAYADALARHAEQQGVLRGVLVETVPWLQDHTEATEEDTGATEEATDAAEEYFDATEANREALEANNEALRAHLELLDEQAEGLAGSVDAMYELEEAEDRAEDALAKYNDAVETQGENSEEASDALRDLRDSAIAVANADVRLVEETNRANGVSTTRVQKIDAENASYIRQANALNGPARDAILAHVLRINGIPETRITEILTDTDPNNLAQTEAELDGPANKRRTAAIVADAVDSSVYQTSADLDAIANKKRTAYIGATGPGYGSNRNQGPQKAARASGDPFTSQGTFLVGEQGPEVVELPAGAEVVPNHRLDTLRPGGDTYTTTIINNWPAGTSQREVAAAQRRRARTQGPL